MADNYCGECALMIGEDIEGMGYCAMEELYTFVYCGGEACDDFIKSEL